MAYLCDPDKNVKCRKTYCQYNPNVSLDDCCSLTIHEEYARRDIFGRPIEVHLDEGNQLKVKVNDG